MILFKSPGPLYRSKQAQPASPPGWGSCPCGSRWPRSRGCRPGPPTCRTSPQGWQSRGTRLLCGRTRSCFHVNRSGGLEKDMQRPLHWRYFTCIATRWPLKIQNICKYFAIVESNKKWFVSLKVYGPFQDKQKSLFYVHRNFAIVNIPLFEKE